MALVYNGEAILAHRNEGNTPYLLVTFIGLYREHVADSVYLMQDLVERENISCIGITTRTRSFYLHHEMSDIAALVRETRRSDQRVIIVGQSSAGFAAAKFANLLEADYVLAFSPIFSAHADDLGLNEDMHGERAFLQSAVRAHRIDPEIVRPGMRPGPEDCAAELFVMFDPAIGSDRWAAHGFAKILPQTRLMPCTDFGHEVFERIYNEQGHHLAMMLACLGSGDGDAAYLILQKLSQRTESAIAALLLRIARWRPWMVDRALETSRAREALTENTRRRHQFNDVTVFEFIRRGRTGDALNYLRKLHVAFFASQDPYASIQTSGLSLLLSYHGDLLTFESESGKVVMTPQGFFSPKRTPLFLDTRGDRPRFVIQLRHSQRPVIVDPASADRDGPEFEIARVTGSGAIAMQRGGVFLTADFAAEPAFTAPHIREWEWFAPIPISDPAVFANTGGLTWFDQIATDDDETNTIASSSRPRRVSFRSRLQQFFN